MEKSVFGSLHACFHLNRLQLWNASVGIGRVSVVHQSEEVQVEFVNIEDGDHA